MLGTLTVSAALVVAAVLFAVADSFQQWIPQQQLARLFHQRHKQHDVSHRYGVKNAHALKMVFQPVTYRSAEIISPGTSRKKLPIIVKESDDKSVLETIKMWESTHTKAEGNKLREWIKRGLVFPSTEEGMRAILAAEAQLQLDQEGKDLFRQRGMSSTASLATASGAARGDSSSDLGQREAAITQTRGGRFSAERAVVRRGSMLSVAASVYKNLGTEMEPILVKPSAIPRPVRTHSTSTTDASQTQLGRQGRARSSSTSSSKAKAKSGAGKGEKKGTSTPKGESSSVVLSVSHLEELESRGDAFRNVSKLFTDERISHKADGIAVRLRDSEEFSPESPQWRTWTEKTSAYNSTSLTQVMREYFRDQSIGDIGGSEIDYVPKRGYPGTLAPGEKFIPMNPIEDLPKRVLHPWPALQQIPFHVRWPPAHPMIPPPILWFALNRYYTDNVTEAVLSRPYMEVVGGTAMKPSDAIRIAEYGRIGQCYEPSEQIKHGGMIFPGGKDIPFYEPDHGPTVSDEEAEPPIPPELRPITERWLDPFFGMDEGAMQTIPTEGKSEAEIAQQEAEVVAEEEKRRAAAEAWIVQSMRSGVDTGILSQAETEDALVTRREAIIEAEVERQLKSRLLEIERVEEDMKSAEIGYTTDDISTLLPHHQSRVQIVDLQAEKEKKKAEIERMRSKIRREIEVLDELESVNLQGRARSRRALISYAIETMRTMQEDQQEVLKSAGLRKGKAKKRRMRKKAQTSFTDSPIQLQELRNLRGASTASPSAVIVASSEK